MPTQKVVWVDDFGHEHPTRKAAEEAEAVQDLENEVLRFAGHDGIDSEALAHWIHDEFLPREVVEPLLRSYRAELKAPLYLSSEISQEDALMIEKLTEVLGEAP